MDEVQGSRPTGGWVDEIAPSDDLVRVKLSEGWNNAPPEHQELAAELNRTPDQHERRESTNNFPNAWEKVASTIPEDELPIVQGRIVQSEIRVDEVTLEPGRYRVEFDGQIVGEVRVTDPIVGHKSNRVDRRRDQGIRKYKLPRHPLAGVSRRSK